MRYQFPISVSYSCAYSRSGHDLKKNDPRIIFNLKKWSVIRDPNHFFNPRSVIRTFFSMIRTCSDQFISHVLMSKNWFESIFRWILVNRSFESTFLLKNDPKNDSRSVIRIILWSMIRDPRSGSFFWRSGPLLLIG